MTDAPKVCPTCEGARVVRKWRDGDAYVSAPTSMPVPKTAHATRLVECVRCDGTGALDG